MHLQQHAGSASLEQIRVPRELYGVAQTLFAIEKHASAGYILSCPLRTIELSVHPVLSLLARFVSPPTVVETAEEQQQQRPVETMFSMPGIELERPIIARQRLIKPPQFLQGVASVVERIGVIRSDHERPVTARQRLVETLQLAQRDPAVAQRLGVVGP